MSPDERPSLGLLLWRGYVNLTQALAMVVVFGWGLWTLARLVLTVVAWIIRP